VRQPNAPEDSDRRQHARTPRAFAFWIQPAHDVPRTSAWMLNTSAGGAAFLTASQDAPALGTRIELLEMLCHDRLVREDAGSLPRYARVLRHDETETLTCRVAVQFEEQNHVTDNPPKSQQGQEWCPFSRTGSPPPPLPMLGAGPGSAVPHTPKA
jgi:hypothetical protein